MKKHLGIFTLAIATLTMVTFHDPLLAQGPVKDHTLLVYFENDKFGGTDEHYTNAVKITWLSPDIRYYIRESPLPEFLRPLIKRYPFIQDETRKRNVGISLGQDIYTPQEIHREDLIECDRPYAGWTYLSFALHSKTCDRMNTIETSLGVVGPYALSEQSQNNIHDLIGVKRAEGWENQLKNEPGLTVTWQHYRRVLRYDGPHNISWDFIPHGGVTVGNVADFVNLGAEMRLGYNLPHDFGTPLIKPGAGVSAPVENCASSRPDFGLQAFVSSEARAVARNIFLDGNTWQDSHRVDKQHLVGDLALGFAARYKRVKLTYTHVYRTREFKDQEGGQTYGSLSLSVSF